jgi:DnaA family protein
MTTIQAQLPLVFETRNAYSFDTLVAGDNELAVGIARQCAQSGEDVPAEKQVLVWSENGCGKSHLLQACCQLAARSESTVCYLPAAEIRDYEPAVLDGMESLDLLAIDDADQLLGDAAWEEGLFDLINRCREASAALLISTQRSPEHLDIRLPDLRSRLQWGPVFHLKPLQDDKKIIALQLRANHRGMMLDQKVAQYLLSHFPRDMYALFERLDHLDRASLAAQRKLTIPFIKSIFDQSSA